MSGERDDRGGRKIGGFKVCNTDLQDQMLANFIETIGNLEAMEKCPHIGEIVDACNRIGDKLRSRMIEAGGQIGPGLLVMAKLIIDRANLPGKMEYSEWTTDK